MCFPNNLKHHPLMTDYSPICLELPRVFIQISSLYNHLFRSVIRLVVFYDTIQICMILVRGMGRVGAKVFYFTVFFWVRTLCQMQIYVMIPTFNYRNHGFIGFFGIKLTGNPFGNICSSDGIAVFINAKHLTIKCHMVITHNFTVEFIHDWSTVDSNGRLHIQRRWHIR